MRLLEIISARIPKLALEWRSTSGYQGEVSGDSELDRCKLVEDQLRHNRLLLDGRRFGDQAHRSLQPNTSSWPTVLRNNAGYAERNLLSQLDSLASRKDTPDSAT